jgi:uncharacterized protein YcfJ
MRNFMLAMGALSLAIPASMTLPVSKAEAKKHYSSRYHHRAKRCRHSSGTTGAVAGGVGGALVGRGILGHGLLGTAGGAVGGFFAGRAIDRTISAKHRCR